MPLKVDAVYENGVLRPLSPLDLREHEQVRLSVVRGLDSSRSTLDSALIERLKEQVQAAGPAPGLDEVRRRLAKIQGSMADEIIAERGDF